MKGKFFVLEGLDGSGKTTVVQRLMREFCNKIVFTREPGGSEFGERIRQVLLDPRSKNVPPRPMLLGFIAARASNFQEKVLPMLRAGAVVVSDRFDASTYAFQLYGQQNMGLEDLFWNLREEILNTNEGLVFRPNYIYLRLDSETASVRRKARQAEVNKETHFDMQTEEFHKRVFCGYEDFFAEINKHSRIFISASENKVKIIDVSLDQNQVYNQVRQIILPAFSL